MPTAYTILFCLIIFVAVTTWFIPAGSYDYVDGVPVAGAYHPAAITLLTRRLKAQARC